MSANSIDHTYTDGAICPWCGEHNGDEFEWCRDEDRWSEVECGFCEKPFRARPHYSVSYSTERIESGASS